MGGCLSRIVQRIIVKKQASAPPPESEMAYVISVDGDLHEYNVPVVVSDVLNAEAQSSSSSGDDSLFVCNSDSLYYNDFIPCMSTNDHLFPDQIYFLLHVSRINERLSAADMATLAVKASSALGKSRPHRHYLNHHSDTTTQNQISPLLSGHSNSQDLDINECEISRLSYTTTPTTTSSSKGKANGSSRSASVRKLHKFTSKRAIMAVCSFKLTLSTIYEGTLL